MFITVEEAKELSLGSDTSSQKQNSKVVIVDEGKANESQVLEVVQVDCHPLIVVAVVLVEVKVHPHALVIEKLDRVRVQHVLIVVSLL